MEKLIINQSLDAIDSRIKAKEQELASLRQKRADFIKEQAVQKKRQPYLAQIMKDNPRLSETEGLRQLAIAHPELFS